MVEWVHFSTQNLYILQGNAMIPLFKNESPQYFKFHLWLKLASKYCLYNIFQHDFHSYDTFYFCFHEQAWFSLLLAIFPLFLKFGVSAASNL